MSDFNRAREVVGIKINGHSRAIFEELLAAPELYWQATGEGLEANVKPEKPKGTLPWRAPFCSCFPNGGFLDCSRI